MVETVILARPRGYCAGVVMAIEALEEAAQENKQTGEGDIVAYHAIVHNQTVVQRLEKQHNVRFVEDLAELEGMEGQGKTVVFSAHGISPKVREEAQKRGLTTLDATCPLVTKVHSESKRYAALGYTILLIGDSSKHQEIIGTFGEAPENTTLSVDDTDKTVEILKKRFPNMVIPSRSDLCYATKNRQAAVKVIAPQVDLFLVVSSLTSSNGMRLVELAESLTAEAYRVDSAEDIQPAWLENVKAVGITSAASTPDDLVWAIVEKLRQQNPNLVVREDGGEPEDIEFRKPSRVAAAA
jgi:4-hydroxy-3-methylbut-2-en-1-yl diphosphate reductase